MTSQGPGKQLEEILKTIQDKKLPPVQKWNPEVCGDIDIVIKRDGSWFYNGTPIGRKRLVKLFSTVLRKDGDEYFLVTPVEKLKIRVEDAPFLAVEMVREGRGRAQVLSFRTQTGDWTIADKDHPIRVNFDKKTREPSPYVLVRDKLEALIHRPVFYELVEMAEHRKKGSKEILGVWSRGEFFPLGEL